MTTAQAKRPTLRAVAERAGVALSTASKVLNQRPNISEETRRRVQRAVEELGYAPTTRSGPPAPADLARVVVVFNTLTRLYSTEVLDGIVAAARDQGVEVVVDVVEVDKRGNGTLSEPWIRDQARQRRTGIIVVTTELSAQQYDLLTRLALTVVHIDPVNPLDDSFLSIGATNFTGGVQATEHLLGLGHRRIAFAGGPERSVPARERKQGYLATLLAAGIEIDRSLVLDGGPFTVDAGIEMGTRLLALPDRPTAVFAGSDLTAMGVYEAARRAGLRIPDDLSVVGFDDSYLAAVMSPPMTTVHQPIADMGRVALRTLLQQARGERTDSHHVQLSTELVVRASTTAPAAA